MIKTVSVTRRLIYVNADSISMIPNPMNAGDDDSHLQNVPDEALTAIIQMLSASDGETGAVAVGETKLDESMRDEVTQYLEGLGISSRHTIRRDGARRDGVSILFRNDQVALLPLGRGSDFVEIITGMMAEIRLLWTETESPSIPHLLGYAPQGSRGDQEVNEWWDAGMTWVEARARYWGWLADFNAEMPARARQQTYGANHRKTGELRLKKFVQTEDITRVGRETWTHTQRYDADRARLTTPSTARARSSLPLPAPRGLRSAACIGTTDQSRSTSRLPRRSRRTASRHPYRS